MFNKYYQDELLFLRDSGREFAEANPEAARFLAQPGSDPDVERMLEGFAFLTAKLRQKLDDELPEVLHSFTEMFWPHYLRPVPACAVMQFAPQSQVAAEVKAIPRGVQIDSVPVDGTRCRFETCYDVNLLPLDVKEAELRRDNPARLTLTFNAPGKLPLDKLPFESVRLHLAGEPVVTRALYVSLLRFVRRIVVRDVEVAGRSFELPPSAVVPVGFEEPEAVLRGPGPSFPGFRLLQEYFAAPVKFMFLDLTGLNKVGGFAGSHSFAVEFEFTRLPEAMPPVSRANFLLNCAPAVNLYRHDADPVRLDPARTEYTIRPAGANPHHHEVFSVNRVWGLEVGTAQPRDFAPQFRLARGARRDEAFYHVRRRGAVNDRGTHLSISFIEPEAPEARKAIETVSIELTCTNGQLPARLEAGDIAAKTQNSPLFATFRNVGKPTPALAPPLQGDLLWRLAGHLSVNFLSLVSVDSLRAVVGLYNLRARLDRQAEQAHARLLEGIKAVRAQLAVHMLKGTPLRGLQVDLTLDEELLGGEGELYFFAAVLERFFAQYVTLNAFTRLKVTGAKFGGVFEWPARMGARVLL
ncbi:MAG: type VI secretion system baseplate subunit TssF [Planctomycetes bacterium]|nr:type VI secretion system baseplate subunit TssF [Planctomycetota bacterium]